MGANTSQVSDLSESQSIRTLIGPDAISENEPFWNQLISFTFTSPTCSADAKLLEEAVVPLAKTLIQNNPRSGNFGALVRVFLSRTKELKISTECQDQLFIWQAHNALFLVRCLLKVFIRQMNEEELHLQFSYQERAPGTYDSICEDLLEELVCNLVHLIVEVPLLDITYNILFEAVTTLLVLLSYQLFHKEVLREGLIYSCRGVCRDLIAVPIHSEHDDVMRNLTDRCIPVTFNVISVLMISVFSESGSFPNSLSASVVVFICGGCLLTSWLCFSLLVGPRCPVLPILEILYHVEERNSHHVYMALIILLILTEDDTFNRSIHEVMLKNISWYTERVLTEISLGSLLILVVIRTIQFNMTRTRDKYLHTNCLAALANMSAQFRNLHQYAAQRIISLFALLSKKHNKVLEQATQSLRGPLGADDTTVLPDYAQDLNVIEEVIRMMLEIINSCLSNSLHHNPNLLYALLYKRELFEQFRSHPSFQDIMQNLDTVIGFFSQRLEQAGSDLSVERVQEVIKKGAAALPKERLKKFPELKFKYVEEEQPEDFFIPYVWSLVFNSGVGLYWNSQGIELLGMDSP
uniref:Dymeclin n=1 Tax=Cyprinus carpio TaxID=7962 RepID=A0A8C1K2S0_CYPCA